MVATAAVRPKGVQLEEGKNYSIIFSFQPLPAVGSSYFCVEGFSGFSRDFCLPFVKHIYKLYI